MTLASRGSLVFALTLAAGMARPAAAAGPSAAADDVDRLFQEANRAYDEQRYDEAEQKYRAAWDRKKTFDIAGNLAQTLLKRGKMREAAELLSYTERTLPPSEGEPVRARVRQMLDEARKHVAAIRISVNPDGSSLSVDARSLGTSPLGDDVFVDPGSHVIAATRAGFAASRRTIEARAGSTEEVRLDLAPERADVAKLPLWPIVAGAGVTVALAGVGLGLFVAGASKSSEADALLAEKTSLCPGGCPDVKDLRATADTDRNIGVALFMAAGVVGAATVVYAIARTTSSRGQSGRAALRPWIAF